MKKRISIDIFTDGSALKNSKDSNAGWCYYLPKEGVIRSGFMIGTNNQAELQAIYEAFLYLSNKEIVTEIVNLYSDSNYALNAISGKNKSKLNVKIIMSIKELIKELGYTINLKHIDAHSKTNDYYHDANNRCDKEARHRAQQGY